MKKTIYKILFSLTVLLFVSCDIDNYPEPGETIRGKIVDVATGNMVLTDQGSEGIRVRLKELSWKETPTPDNFDFFCMKEGIFQNTKIFKGYYNIRVDGPFIPIVRINNQGDTIADESLYMDIAGTKEVEFKVQPFLNIEWVGQPTVSNGKITATFIVTRGVTPADFRAKIEPMGNYSDNFLNVTDVRLFVSQVPFVGYREWDNRYSVENGFGGSDFEVNIGKPYTITTNGVIPPGRTVFIRAAARINYSTEGIRRHNYNEAIRVDIPR